VSGLRIVICRAVAVLALALPAACHKSGPTFLGTDITGADYGRSLALTGHDGKSYTLADFRGKAVVLSFGFTHCPDVCPTTLAQTAAAMKALGPLADRVQVLFVTLDPERDSAVLLSKYVPAFDRRFLGLRGSPEATRAAAKEFKIYYEKRAGATPDAYSVDHSAQTYVFDTAGRLRLFIRHDRLGEALEHDLRVPLGS